MNETNIEIWQFSKENRKTNNNAWSPGQQQLKHTFKKAFTQITKAFIQNSFSFGSSKTLRALYDKYTGLCLSCDLKPNIYFNIQQDRKLLVVCHTRYNWIFIHEIKSRTWTTGILSKHERSKKSWINYITVVYIQYNTIQNFTCPTCIPF